MGPKRPLTDAEVEKARADMDAWLERQRVTAAHARERSKSRNDAIWRRDCIALYGERCVACGDRRVEMDHIIPRSQGGRSVVENGLPLCGAWSQSVDGGHHGMKTAGTLKIRREWLTEAQVVFLAEQGWVYWNDRGRPLGRGYRHFDEARPN